MIEKSHQHKFSIRIGVKLLNLQQRFFLRPGHLGYSSFVRSPYRIINPKRLFIGDNTRIGKYSFIVIYCEPDSDFEPTFKIGNNVSIGHDFFAGCTQSITIEDDVLISSRVFMGDAIHDYRDITKPIISQGMTKHGEIIIEQGSFIGVNACILPGIRICKHAVVGAAAVVTRDVAPYTVVAGNPARIIKRYEASSKSWINCDTKNAYTY